MGDEMTKEEALHRFFSSFGMDAYGETAVPADAALPYLTYRLATGGWGDGESGITVNLWFRTESEEIPNEKARELSRAIGMGGQILRCRDGAVWLKRGSPWCQSLSDDSDKHIKRRYINVTAEYLTMD